MVLDLNPAALHTLCQGIVQLIGYFYFLVRSSTENIPLLVAPKSGVPVLGSQLAQGDAARG